MIVAGAWASWPAVASALPPECGEIVLHDDLSGSTLGNQQGGTLNPGGFLPGGTDPPGSIVWPLASLREGCIEIGVLGVVTEGVGEHDLLELFTGPSGSFDDGTDMHFLRLALFGDLVPEHDGQLGLEVGLEGDPAAASGWSSSFSWGVGTDYTIAIRLTGGGVAEIYRDDMLRGSIDYGAIAGGELAFVSLRVPNDGVHYVHAPLDGAVFTRVTVYDAEVGGNDTSSTAGDTDVASSDWEPPPDEMGTSTTGGKGGTVGGTTGSVTAAGATSTGTGSSAQDPGDRGCGCRASGPDGGAWLLVGLLGLVRRRRALRGVVRDPERRLRVRVRA